MQCMYIHNMNEAAKPKWWWSLIYEKKRHESRRSWNGVPKNAKKILFRHSSQVTSVWDWTKNDKDQSYNTHLPALPAPVELTPSWLDSLPDLKPFRQRTSRQQSTRCCSQSANKQMGHCGWHKEHCKPKFGRREYVSCIFLNLRLDILISSNLHSFAAEISYSTIKEVSVKQLSIKCK